MASEIKETIKDPDAPASTAERIFAASVFIGAAVSSFTVWFFNPVTVGFFPQCPLHSLTGLNCPGCSLTRGFHALFQGDVLGALRFNLLLPIYAFLISYLMLSLFLTAVRGRGLSWKVFPPAALYGFLIISVVFAVVRNIPVYPFFLLSPP